MERRLERDLVYGKIIRKHSLATRGADSSNGGLMGSEKIIGTTRTYPSHISLVVMEV